MPIFRWGQAWGTLQELEREMDRLLQGMDHSVRGVRMSRSYPPVNVYSLDSEYVITSEIPGVIADHLDLSIASGLLTIRGKRIEPEHQQDPQFRRRERFQGEWERTVSIPDRVLEDELRAELKEGVLTIHLPKAPQTKTRSIPINTSS